MVLEHFIITKAEDIVENGYRIGCKEEEFYIMVVAR